MMEFTQNMQKNVEILQKKQILRACRRLLWTLKRDRLRASRLASRLSRAAGRERRLLCEEELAAHRAEMSARREELSLRMSEARALIACVDDPTVRRILTLYYLEGMTWQRVAFAIGAFSESVPRKKHDRYFLAEAKHTPAPPSKQP